MTDSAPRRVFDVADPDVAPYPLLNSLVVPRPIAWISTVSEAGVGNLAPHSFFTVACTRPPIVQFTSVGSKDTLRNVLGTGECVVNVAARPLLEQVNGSSAPFDDAVDEADWLGVEMEPSARVAVPRVAASPAAIECTLHSTIELGDSTVVLLDVVAITVQESALEGDHPAIGRLEPLSRLGLNEWGLPPEVIAVDRPRRPSDVPRRP
ncbi:flavin reductase family protein [Nocardioides donggukensis]|uniref:Flavin reductase family protein n=1 Tax=Nocardioides donggukensis TaxID=2774019 RepID=A0A927K527_9ACTN|nr:flavin reductase family protein [Nocardioides donggukensis]MBD8870397.1 flavin reductase family protein [Nocardioides donggukensis]